LEVRAAGTNVEDRRTRNRNASSTMEERRFGAA
jgi:hypothetical protein